jgi:hypothetical protein
MRHTLAFAGVTAALLVAASGEGFAKPKKTVLGCTMEQIQQAASTPAGAECSKRQDDSIINGTTFIVFVCVADGVYCCPENATSASQCSKVSGLSSGGNPALQSIVTKGVLRATSATTKTQPAAGAAGSTKTR